MIKLFLNSWIWARNLWICTRNSWIWTRNSWIWTRNSWIWTRTFEFPLVLLSFQLVTSNSKVVTRFLPYHNRATTDCKIWSQKFQSFLIMKISVIIKFRKYEFCNQILGYYVFFLQMNWKIMIRQGIRKVPCTVNKKLLIGFVTARTI